MSWAWFRATRYVRPALLLLFVSAGSVLALGITAAPVAQEQQFSAAELDELLAPVALFPDPLIAQILPAATFADQIDEAARVLGGRTDEETIGAQTWDVSVKSLAHYPDLIGRMAQHMDWTVAVGQAYVIQPQEVMASIQRLRAQANAAGNLVSNEQQTVTVESPTVIQIEPADPEYIYVPVYDDDAVYWDDAAEVVFGFGAGLAMGAWLNNAVDWYGRGIYYHGWAGSGWVAASRPHVDHRNNNYVNQRFNQINVDRSIANRDVGGFRETVRRDGNARVEHRAAGARGRPVDAARRTDGGVRDTRADALRNRQHGGQRLETYRGRQPEAGVRQPQAGARPRQMPARPQFQRPPAAGARPAAQVSRRPATSPRPSAFSGANYGSRSRAHSARGHSSMRGGGGRARAGGGGRRREP